MGTVKPKPNQQPITAKEKKYQTEPMRNQSENKLTARSERKRY